MKGMTAMSKRPRKSPPEAVSELQRQIGEWREGRPKPGCRIPEKFWTAATRLGRDFGVSLVSHHLKLDYHGLKRRVLALSKTPQKTPVGFVEVRMDTPSSVSPEGDFVTEIAVYKGRDKAMRVRQSGPVDNDLSAIIASFMRGSC